MTVTFTIYVDTLEASAEGARRGGEEGEMEKEVKTAKKSEGDGDGGGGVTNGNLGEMSIVKRRKTRGR